MGTGRRAIFGAMVLGAVLVPAWADSQVDSRPAAAPLDSIATIAGNGTAGFSGDGGSATTASINQPFRLALDRAGNLYVADRLNHRIRKVSASGEITTVAGTGVAGFSGDGGPATAARLNFPSGIVLDAAGNLWIADSLNHRVRRVDTLGIIRTAAGTGEPGYSGDGGPAIAARLFAPSGLALGTAGVLYIADEFNHRVRRVEAIGAIVTFAGAGEPGFRGDNGQAAGALLNQPAGLAFDTAGNLFVADAFNHRLRRVAPNGVITTVAGTGQAFSFGDGGRATAAGLDEPVDVATDSAGNRYIVDQNGHRIRKVTPDGRIIAVAGAGISGYSGDGGHPLAAMLNFPNAVAVDAAGNFFISDSLNARVRRVTVARPLLPAGAVVNGAHFRPAAEPGSAVAPGSIVSIFGSDLADGTMLADSLPLLGVMLDTRVTFNNIPAPLFFVSGGQINAQVPFDVAEGSATVRVQRGVLLTEERSVQVAGFAPGIFTTNRQGSGQGAILIGGTATLAAPVPAGGRPAAVGEVLSIFCTGLGAVTNPPAPGAAASANPLSRTIGETTVFIGGQRGIVTFSGLAPGFVGVYQVNVEVAAGTPSGDAVPVVLTAGSVAANPVTVAIR